VTDFAIVAIVIVALFLFMLYKKRNLTIGVKDPKSTFQPDHIEGPLGSSDPLSSIDEKKPGDEEEAHSMLQNQKSVKDKIDDYLIKYEEDRLNYDLNHFIYPQFNMFAKSVPYKITIPPIASLEEIGVARNELNNGLTELVNMTKIITGSDQEIAWPDALSFLFDFAKINARINGLKLIATEITDFDRYNEYMSQAEKNKNELLQRFRCGSE